MPRLEILTARECAAAARIDRSQVDAACSSGALVAYNAHPESSKKSWRIIDADLEDWVRRGFPKVVAA